MFAEGSVPLEAESEEAMPVSWESVEQHPLQHGQTFREFIARISDVGRSLDPVEPTVNCMDEGIYGGLRMAGSGILEPDEQKVIAAWTKNGVIRVTSHSDCGAAVGYADRHRLPQEMACRAAAHRIQELAEKAGIEYAGHIDVGQLHRPEGHHIAFVVYYDGTGRFDASRVPGLPQGFTISRALWGERKNPVAESDLAVHIAIGKHGWGRRFAETGKQFILIPIGSVELPTEQLVAELRPLLGKYGKQIRIDPVDASDFNSA